MLVHQISNDAKFLASFAAVAAGTTDTQTGTEVDMAGFTGVCFAVLLGTITSTGVATLTAKNSDTSNTYGAGTIDSLVDPVTAAVAAASATTGESGKLLVLDIHRPPRRYVRPQVARATANVVIAGGIAIVYNAQTGPVTQAGASALGFAQPSNPSASLT